jgi:hypothetical protein
MKAHRIKEGEFYMAVVRGVEILIRADFVMLDHVYGKKVESGAGIALHVDAFVAGPLPSKKLSDEVSQD